MDPLVVVWRVTERCNLACPFCAFDRTVQGPRGQQGYAAAAAGIASLAELVRAGRAVTLSWLGGEPLLWPHLRPLSELARSHGIRLSVTTNGSRLAQPEWLRWAAETFAEITLSIDGDERTHDQLRGAGHRALCLGVIRQLRQVREERHLELTLKVNTILMRQTIGSFRELALELAAAGADALTFNDLGGADRPAFYPEHRTTPEQVEGFAAAFEGIQAEAARLGLTLLGDRAYLHRLLCTSRGIKLPVADCHPGAGFWFVDSGGQLSPCSFTADTYRIPMASLTTLEELAQVPRRLEALRGARVHPACLDCKSTQVFSKFKGTSVPGTSVP